MTRRDNVTHPRREQRRGTNRVPGGATESGLWLYGLHVARAALANPLRKVRRAVLSPRAVEEIGPALLKNVRVESVTPDVVARMLPPGSVHQGVALLCEPLPQRDIDDVLDGLPAGKRIIAILDQVTDPHNEGAILRSAAAFGIAAVIVQDRNSAPESGALAKAASGALDIVPRISVVNIARTMEQLGERGFWRVALAGDGDAQLSDSLVNGDMVIVLGAEGGGIRRLVRERADAAAFIPMALKEDSGLESLNVSNAASIAFYEVTRRLRS